MTTNTCWTTLEAFKQTKIKFFAGQATEAQLDAAADAYIEAVKAYKRSHKGVKLPVPSRASLRRSTPV